jgi:zinc transport system substrate-binding protein
MKLKIFLVLLIGLVSCDRDSSQDRVVPEAQGDKPLVIASNYPLFYFANEIAGESAEIVLPEMEGDPAEYKPDGEAISRLQTADLVLLNGAGYESWLSWVTLDDDHLLDTSAGFSERLIPLPEDTVHQHGPGGEHSHSGTAFTVWLDPMLAIEQARAIEKGLSELVPKNAQAHGNGLAALVKELEELDQSLAAAFEKVGGEPLLFSHPVYQYLESRYGLDGVSLHWEPEEEPGTRAWIDLQQKIHNHAARLMIWEDDPLEATSRQLGQMGLIPVSFHTAANLPDSGDYFEVMAANIERLQLQCCGMTIDHSD